MYFPPWARNFMNFFMKFATNSRESKTKMRTKKSNRGFRNIKIKGEYEKITK